MAERITARVDASTGRFLEDGRPADGVAILEVVVARNPDVARDRYTGDVNDPIREATTEEIEAHATTSAARAADAVLASDRTLRVLGNALVPILAPALRVDPAVLRQQIRDAVKSALAAELKEGR